VARTKQKKLQQLNELPNVFNIKEAELKVKLKKYFKIEKNYNYKQTIKAKYTTNT